MIILTKKKIFYPIILIILFIFFYIISQNKTINKKEEFNTIQTMALPTKDKIIVLDAGHGVPDERCRK